MLSLGHLITQSSWRAEKTAPLYLSSSLPSNKNHYSHSGMSLKLSISRYLNGLIVEDPFP